MIKKLRRRFTVMAVTLTGVVLLALFLTIYLSYYIFNYNNVRNSLESFATHPRDYSYSSDISDNDETEAVTFLKNVCIISVNTETNTITVSENSSGAMSDSVLTKAVTEVEEHGDGFGMIESLNLFYYKLTPDDTTSMRIVFSNSATFYKFFNDLFTSMIIIYIMMMLVIYAISKLIVVLSLKPAEKVWNQQQNFIADASHELKTPLTVILTNTKILMSHRDDTIGNQMTWVNSTYEESTHMKDLVEKLLLLAKTDNTKKKKMFTPIDISDLAIRLSLQYEPVAFEKGVTLNTDIENGIKIKGEPTAINQIIHILLDNAIKYAGVAGEVTLTLREAQKHVYISCTNTGDPIPAEDLPHIFERFYRSDKVRTTGSGYGLGLAICKNLVDIHKGEITCTSNAVSGTTFTVRLKEYTEKINPVAKIRKSTNK